MIVTVQAGTKRLSKHESNDRDWLIGWLSLIKKGRLGEAKQTKRYKTPWIDKFRVKSHAPWGNESSDRPVRTGFLSYEHRIRSKSVVTSVTEIRGDCACMTLIYGGKKKAGPRTHGGDRPRNCGKGKIHDWPRTHGGDRPRNRRKGKIHGFPQIRGKLRSLSILIKVQQPHFHLNKFHCHNVGKSWQIQLYRSQMAKVWLIEQMTRTSTNCICPPVFHKIEINVRI